MKVIGITGGVGSGKSALLNALRDRYNCIILYSDDAAKELEQPGHECYDRLVELLGRGILDDRGYIVNSLMAQAIFSGQDMLSRVNNIIHPAVKDYILGQIDAARSEGRVDYFFLEAALLIECGYNQIVDEMWYIYADRSVREARLRSSRGYSDDKIASIMSKQLSEEEYRAGSQVVIDNSGSIEDSLRQIADHLK